jgi:hypothetical protein
MRDLDWQECDCCGDDVSTERWQLGYRVCMSCGEAQAREARSSWTVIQEYGKGPYQFIPQTAVHQTLRETNQKQLRT